MNVPDMSVAGLCAKFASTIKWHRTSLRGGGDTLVAMFCSIKNGCLFKTQLTYDIY